MHVSAAFDTVDYDILIRRLYTKFGVRGKVLSWFKSYFTDWSQCVSRWMVLPQESLASVLAFHRVSVWRPYSLSSTHPGGCSILLSYINLRFTVLLMTLSYIYNLNLVMPKQETKPLQLWRIVYVILEHGCFKTNWRQMMTRSSL